MTSNSQSIKVSDLYLAIDIGGTKTIIALVENTNVVATERFETNLNGFEDFLADFYINFKKLCGELKIDPMSITSAVIASPGLLDFQKGIVIRAINLNWTSVYLVQRLREILHIEDILLFSDKSCAALAEYTSRLGYCSNLLYITVSTGISCAFVIDGKIWNGTNNFAGEIGQIVTQGIEFTRDRTLEGISSGGAILRNSGKTGDELQAQADAGDVDAEFVLVKAGQTMAMAVYNLFQVFDPEICVIGGGVAVGSETFFNSVRQTLRNAEGGLSGRKYPIEKSSLGANSVIQGVIQLSGKSGRY